MTNAANATSELNTVFDYDSKEQTYLVTDADTGDLLFSASSLNEAWNEVKDECERREVAMGYCDYRNKGPDLWDEVQR